jgi:hypothetical protein
MKDINMNNAQPTTRGHKTCRFQWVFERFVPPQAFATVDSDAAPQSGTFHTANRYSQLFQAFY